jgi:methylated-DNA-[protein]-cysteine S-methyltransferase
MNRPAAARPAAQSQPAAPLYWIHPSPVGELLLTTTDGHALSGLHMLPEHRHGPRIRPDWRRDPEPFAAATAQLDAYFAGELTAFDLPLAPQGTPFQLDVWRALCEIPYGRTASYGEIARAIGHPDRARAVGAANGRNPISIVVPCHRVIGANGDLVGYGGGLERKRFLLALEGSQLPV